MKFCPNCGEQIDGDTRFCTHCGFDLTQTEATNDSEGTTTDQTTQTEPEQTNAQATSDQQPAPQPANDRVAQLQSLSKNYFKWFVDSLKRPNEEVPAQKYFGLISMLITALLLTFAIVAAINRFIKQVAAAANTSITINNISFSMDVKLFFLVVVGILFYVVIGYGASVLGERDNKVNFFDFVNRFAHLTNVGIVLDLVLIVSVFTITFNYSYAASMSFLKQLVFTIMVLTVIGLIWQVGYMLAISDSIHAERIDKFYVIVLALIVLSLAFYVFTRIEGENLILDFTSEFSRYTNGLGNFF